MSCFNVLNNFSQYQWLRIFNQSNCTNSLFSTNFSTSTDSNDTTSHFYSNHTVNNKRATRECSSHNDLHDNSTGNHDNRLTHVDHHGNAHMVNVGSKSVSSRRATASGYITLSPKAFRLVCDHQLSKKGPVLGVAQLAGIMAAKRTSSLIPLCHNVPLTHVSVDFKLCEAMSCVRVCTSVECVGVTGVEMEVLCAVSVALLTVYDMTKAVAKDHVISEIRLEEKEGGASGHYKRLDNVY